ncbi:pentapeptide repeat-containing protein [Streptomyces sp. NRRL F-4489]|uniref:pentapeptide repeat-containing protein n=1 Tax=Streptomyces sp. NRRL F-4489 TaxID=1609095 RepID=UPI00131DF47D|nr:pentapeptide repeat-containing protein [Streptomyces sp. NRRL F-4489]
MGMVRGDHRHRRLLAVDVEGPWWLDGGHLRRTDLQPADGAIITGFRTMLAALLAGVVAALGLWYTHRNHVLARRQFEETLAQFEHMRHKDRQEVEIARDGQATKRYVEAVQLLASEKLTARLGGIYALERIMRDSEKDHGTIVEVLAAFIRQNAPALPDEAAVSSEYPVRVDGTRQHVREDTQAALSVLGRRPRRTQHDVIDLSRTCLRRADLSRAQLRGANLAHSQLEHADLSGAQLSDADLCEARLEHARLTGAGLERARLERARLEHADLSVANLERARLREAHCAHATFAHAQLARADFGKAHGEHADFTDADVEGANFVQAHLDGAHLGGAVGNPVLWLPGGGDREHAGHVPEQGGESPALSAALGCVGRSGRGGARFSGFGPWPLRPRAPRPPFCQPSTRTGKESRP